MNTTLSKSEVDYRVWQALAVWGIYMILTVILNGTVQFGMGVDLRNWTYSQTKDVLINLCVYGGLFLVAPLILTKGWVTVRQPGFWLPLLVGILAMTLRPFFRPAAAAAVGAIAYLHWRYDLSELGIRSKGWRGDLMAILLLGGIYLVPSLWQARTGAVTPVQAFLAGLDRMFANPASTTESLFYFGFLAERLSYKTGRWLTPVLIGLMYMLHEMTNPEYWYEGSVFYMIWIGVALITLVYLWRRSIVVVWLGDGLGRFLGRLV